ncbi:MAG: hypothetical protein VYB30_06420 [Candidatus Thermoplasmatota archaeon]|nr:hypothetical protein [Candidatus Thermoplasmatota archaeon]
MARPSKAARGKFRWIGLRINQGELSRNYAQDIIQQIMVDTNFRIFDFLSQDSSTLVIIRVALEDKDIVREKFQSHSEIESLTTSGKIRLVRNRMDLPKPTRKK